jgi:hypothetical protein
VAIGNLERWLQRKYPVPPGTLAVAAGLGMLFLGPLPQIYRFPNNWTNHGLFQYHYDREDPASYYDSITTPPTLSSFYVELGKQPPGTVTLLEAPWYYEWHNNPFPHFQAIHRQRMLIGFVDDPASWQRAGEYPPGLWKMRFRNFVHLSQHSKIVAKGVDYVVMHKNLAAEVQHPEHRSPVDMSGWIAEYRARYGKPYYEDPQIVVFELAAEAESISETTEERLLSQSHTPAAQGRYRVL